METSTTNQRLPAAFFARDTLLVARELLGVRLVRLLNGERLSGIIVETEAYIGSEDTACHASKGRTPRNEVMFGAAGHAYVYFTYGLHHLINVVTESEGMPAAVLLRALQPCAGTATMRSLRTVRGVVRKERDLTAGPARLTAALAIDKTFNGANLMTSDTIWLETGETYADTQVARGPRIGIGYAAEQDRLAPWRFWVSNNRFVSK
jgi:DNA-3-methyladenine glycosylase